MSKYPKIDKKTASRMQVAEVALPESGVWDFRIGKHLRGKLQPGDAVVVEVPSRDDGGEPSLIMRVGRVNGLKPVSKHRPEHVFGVVDKIKIDRYLEAKREERKAADLYAAACELARMLQQLKELRSTAEESNDEELLAMVGNLEEIHACKDADENPMVDVEAPAWVDADPQA